MDTTEKDRELAVLTSVTELHRQLKDSIEQLSLERLQVLADFATYLTNADKSLAKKIARSDNPATAKRKRP